MAIMYWPYTYYFQVNIPKSLKTDDETEATRRKISWKIALFNMFKEQHLSKMIKSIRT